MCNPIRIRHSCNHSGRKIGKKSCIYFKFIEAYNNPDSPLNAKYAKLLETCNDPESGRKLDLKYGVDIYRRECEKCSGEESCVYVDRRRRAGLVRFGWGRGERWRRERGQRSILGDDGEGTVEVEGEDNVEDRRRITLSKAKRIMRVARTNSWRKWRKRVPSRN
jgi:hypothetical protein